MEKTSDLLPLGTMFNVRDLGGLPILNAGSTRSKIFLRGDDPADLSSEDIEYLKQFGLTMVIDLRSCAECEQRPNPLKDESELEFYSVPLGTDNVGDISRLMAAASPSMLSDFYIQMITQQQDRLSQIFHLLARVDRGAALFHCSAGKDRTGIIAMLLLDLAGVSSHEICQNYSSSFENIMKNPLVRRSAQDIPTVLLESRPETMERVLDMLRETYGSAREYLLAAGCQPSELNGIMNRFVQE